MAPKDGMLFRRTYLQHPPHLPGHTSSGTQLACTKNKSGILSGSPVFGVPWSPLRPQRQGKMDFFFSFRDIGVLWRAKFLYLDPKTNSGRSEALLKLLGKKLLHL